MALFPTSIAAVNQAWRVLWPAGFPTQLRGQTLVQRELLVRANNSCCRPRFLQTSSSGPPAFQLGLAQVLPRNN